MRASGSAHAVRRRPAGRPYYTVADHLGMLRRQLVPLLLAALAGAVLGGVGTLVAPREYAATAGVLVTPTGVGVNNPARNRAPAGVDLDTESKLITSAGVVSAVQRQLPGERDLVARLHVRVPPNSAVLLLRFTADTPAVAARGANAFATAYLADRRQRAQDDLDSAIVRRRTQLAALEQELRRESQRSREGDVEEALSTARTQVLTRQLATLSASTTALSSSKVTPGRLLKEAVPPPGPSAPIGIVWVVSGLGVGILVGVAVAQLREHLSRQAHRPDDVPRLLGLRVLARLPGEAGSPGEGDTAHAAAELAALAPPPHRTVLVIGAAPGESGAAAVHLAAALGRAGFRTLAVLPSGSDAPVAAEVGAPSAGLSDVVRGRRSPEEASIRLPGIAAETRVMGPGTVDPDADPRLADAEVTRLAVLGGRVDYLLVATTPTVDAVRPLRDPDLAVLTLRLRGTPLTAARATLRRVRGVPVAGALLAPRAGTVVTVGRTEGTDGTDRVGAEEPAAAG